MNDNMIPEKPDISCPLEADVVVIGAGTSGLITANSAMDEGLDVVLISASTKPISRGGSNGAAYSKAMRREGYPRMSLWHLQKERNNRQAPPEVPPGHTNALPRGRPGHAG